MSNQVFQPPYTLKEIAYLISRHCRRPVKPKTLYDWLPYALIPQPKTDYSHRDAKKLVFVAQSLARVRSLEYAKQRLAEDIQANPYKYEDSPYVATIEL